MQAPTRCRDLQERRCPLAVGESDCQVGPGGARNFDKVGLCPRNLHRAGADLAFLGVMRDDARCVAARSRAHRPAWRVPHRSIMRRVSDEAASGGASMRRLLVGMITKIL